MYAGYGIKVDGYHTSMGLSPSNEFTHIIQNNTFSGSARK
jgi:hypothetical protein